MLHKDIFVICGGKETFVRRRWATILLEGARHKTVAHALSGLYLHRVICGASWHTGCKRNCTRVPIRGILYELHWDGVQGAFGVP